ncbi:MAG: adenylate/guanylate cyclase domain-containing protein [Candidatus Magnetominusculus sp. LBB02]|nr:adenylate/guanylate cyclase domain-containing protein [Candidatus Magnetominusculus sp. LBB02]
MKPVIAKTMADKALRGLLIGLIIGVVSIVLGFLKIPASLELYTLDLRYQLRPQPEVSSQLGYVDFDDESLALFGQWPWPRMRHTALVNTLSFYGARAIGFDVFFAEKENVRLIPGRVKDYISSAKTPDLKEFQRVVEGAFKDYDKEFEEAVKKAGIVHLAYFSQNYGDVGNTNDISDVLKKTKQVQAKMTDQQAASLRQLLNTSPPPANNLETFLLKDIGITPPLPELIAAAKGVGYARPGLDKDSVIRNFPLIRYYDNKITYPLALSMLSDVMDFKLNDIAIVPGSSIALRNALRPGAATRTDIVIPVDKHSQMLVNWTGRFNDTFLHVPFKYLSYYYAFILAKEEARTSGGALTAEALETKIRSKIDDQGIAANEESALIAKKITTAWFISKLIDAGADDNALSKTLSSISGSADLKAEIGEIRAAKDIEQFINIRPTAAPEDFIKTYARGVDPARLSEIFKNMQTFQKQGRLKDVYPYYFPPPLELNNNGIKTAFSPLNLSGKLLIAGLTATGTIDFYPTPFEKSAPMVSYHVNALNTIITGNYLRRIPGIYNYAITLLLAVLTGLLCSLLALQAAFPLSALLAGGYLFSTYRLWITKGYWFDWIAPVGAVALTFLVLALVRYFEAYFERRRIRLIFSKMVSPSVLKTMEANPDKFALTGERKEAAIFFSLIQGMSNVITGVSPDELPAILDVYLSPNSEIITGYDGYIDKYEGHVIMADFGVPIGGAYCALKCAFAAIEQNLDIEAFQRLVLMRYGLNVSVSMGFNYGYVSAGNMGSDRKFQYTVMGDSVNVAARFMAANYIYNAKNALTGEDAVPEIKDYVHLRMLDKLLLKGKTRPTAIYEVLGWVAEAYRDFHKSKPVPQFVKYNWLRCSPEKFFCYRDVWKRRAEDSGDKTAAEIYAFFDRNMPLASEILTAEWSLEYLSIQTALQELRQRAAKVLGRSVAPLPHSGDALSDIASELTGMNDLMSGYDGRDLSLLNDCEGLSVKAASFQSRLYLQEGFDELSGAISSVKRFIGQAALGSGQAINAALMESQLKYKTLVKDFYGNLRPEAYHEMAAGIGSPSAAALKSKAHYEAGLQLYFQRRWDEAVEMFKMADTELQGDPPANSLIKRIELYKESPPPPSWQGEFIQTKK